jgi:pimeloyl-ACP methyl ester carboxylesterase
MNHPLRLAVILLLTGMSLLAFGQARPDQFFDANGVRLRYIEQGTGEPVVLLHGFLGNAERTWVTSEVFQQLAKHYRVIAVDCRGHGKSDKPHRVKQYGQEMAFDVTRLLDHLKIRQAHIVGYSMGGNIVAKLLTLKPERFLTATLGGSGGMLNLTATEIGLFEQLAADLEKGSLRSMMLALAPKDQPPPTEDQIKQSAARLAGQDLAALAAVARSLPELVITEKQVSTIKTPTLAIVGTADATMDAVNKLKQAMPALKVVSIEKAAHGNAVGRPEFIEALRAFLKAHSTKK